MRSAAARGALQPLTAARCSSQRILAEPWGRFEGSQNRSRLMQGLAV